MKFIYTNNLMNNVIVANASITIVEKPFKILSLTQIDSLIL